MKKLNPGYATLPIVLAASLLFGGCSSNNSQPNEASQQAQQQQKLAQAQQRAAQAEQQAAQAEQRAQQAQQQAQEQANATPAPPPEPTHSTIPAGTHIRITTNQDLGSKISRPGQTFTATVASAVRAHGLTLIRAGSRATGTVIDAKSLGRFKGQAQLALRLDSITSDGRTYDVQTSSIDRVEKGKGKRTAVLAGGGGGLGALIGGLAGGGKGALIGALAGAGGGAAGAAFTGNKEIVIPAETELTFRLDHSVRVRR